ncbi:MAG: MFS transporter [Candidatus Kapaibacterium sp.]|nr:MAG: MFS transporter [Candidatus Kapabacteria bacterium]
MIIPILAAITIAHLLNDIVQSVIPAIFPILQQTLRFSYTELGFIAFANNMTASLMQPLVGWYTDRKPHPYSLVVGMSCTLVGMLLLGYAHTLLLIVVAVMLVGLGSAIFHPEGSRIVMLSAGRRLGLGQSIFQVGGNAGQSLAPLMTILIFAPLGQIGAVWFVGVAGLALVMLYFLAGWYKEQLPALKHRTEATRIRRTAAQERIITRAMVLLFFLSFARAWFVAGMGSFYAFYQMEHWHASLQTAQIHTFVFMLFGAIGILLGGPLAERFGKRNVLMFSIFGCAPFALGIPFASGIWAYLLLAASGFAILSGFSVALMYMFDLLPGRTGFVSGLMFGLAFGLGAVGSLALGKLADMVGLDTMMLCCCILPCFGILTVFLPNDARIRAWNEHSTQQ